MDERGSNLARRRRCFYVANDRGGLGTVLLSNFFVIWRLNF